MLQEMKLYIIKQAGSVYRKAHTYIAIYYSNHNKGSKVN